MIIENNYRKILLCPKIKKFRIMIKRKKIKIFIKMSINIKTKVFILIFN